MRTRIWGVGLLLGLTLGLFSAGTALAAGPLLNLASGDSGTINIDLTGNVDSTATTTAAATATNDSDVVTDVVNTVANTVNGLSGGVAVTPTPTQAATPAATETTTNASVTTAATVTTSAATPVATSTPEATATTQATATASDSTTSSATEPTTVQNNASPTVDQTVANANDSIQQVTDDGQQVLGVNGVTEATTDINVATNLSDPGNGPMVDSNICLNATVLTYDDPAAANCSTTPADTTTGLANVGLQTGRQSTSILGTGTDLTNNVCLDAQVSTNASSNCNDSTNNGLANVGLSNDTGLGAPDVFGNLGGLEANSCLDANVSGTGSNGCTVSSSNGLLNLGSSAGINSTGDVAGFTGISSNVCLNAALLASTDANCQTANNGDNGNGDNGGNTGDNGGNTGDIGDSGGNSDGNTGDTGGNSGGQNGNTGGNTGESGGQGGVGNGGTTTVNGGQGGSGSGGLIPVSYVPSNGGSAGNGTGGVNVPSASTNLPSLMPATGRATVVATPLAGMSSSDAFLLTLAGLLLLLAGGFVTRQARIQQGQISDEEAR